MHGIKYAAASLSLLLLAGCSDDPETKTVVAPVIEEAERLAPVALSIPGVDGDAPSKSVAEVAQNTEESIDTIERTIPPEEPEVGTSVPTVDAPLPLLLSDIVQQRFVGLQSSEQAIPMIDAVFYPLGWSTDGKFAYAVEPPSEASDTYFLNIYIQDLVTDKILWKDEYRGTSSSSTRSFAAYWAANEKTIDAQFAKYSIVESKQTNLMAGPIPYENDLLSYEVQKQLAGQPDFGNIAMVTQYQVNVKSTSRGSKVVHKETYKSPMSVLDVDVIGYLQGSDPERAALLVGGVRRGWEGPPHVTWFKIIGTNLRRGFK